MKFTQSVVQKFAALSRELTAGDPECRQRAEPFAAPLEELRDEYTANPVKISAEASKSRAMREDS